MHLHDQPQFGSRIDDPQIPDIVKACVLVIRMKLDSGKALGCDQVEQIFVIIHSRMDSCKRDQPGMGIVLAFIDPGSKADDGIKLMWICDHRQDHACVYLCPVHGIKKPLDGTVHAGRDIYNRSKLGDGGSSHLIRKNMGMKIYDHENLL